ncbi:MAG: DUF885 domain-containing protein [Candidatus Eremiobacteraeota bacterium]|nr:DUF885 domain-containing protein [Candidatus Eremiobacteraeota bacterium]MCW5868599.1 DUF885 domain-containing protein [Candidatus Eremiobacteraeota bacterium]
MKYVWVLALLLSSSLQAQPAWVARSNLNTRYVLEEQARFVPEEASANGLTQYDGLSLDLGPQLSERRLRSNEQMLAELRKRLAQEKDTNVCQDLEILIGSLERDNRRLQLHQKYLLAWVDAPGVIFGGMRVLLNDQTPPARRAKAVELLQHYVGQAPGTKPLTELAKARFMERRAPGLLGPTRLSVEDSLANSATYVQGIRQLFQKYQISGGEPALAALESQVNDYAKWERENVLPVARADFKMPPELYAFTLKQWGIDVEPDTLIQSALLEFMETRAALQQLAPLVAREKGFAETQYPKAIALLKLDKIPNERLETEYKECNAQIEVVIRREKLVNLPDRPMQVRLASEAESAAQPAPHMDPPPLANNHGEQGTFVLPVSVANQEYDDFNFPGATWTVSAHEGRPGHELQFTAMVERGVSLARVLYARNSVNVEGWALYAEAEMLPHHPLDGQLIALQMRLLRAARAFLDPMLNLGRITPEEARRILLQEVAVSPAMAKQEIDRYTFRHPGQAGTYFYGYTRILQLRMQTELRLGSKFDRLRFNNFLLDQGLLPPDLMERAVNEVFLPSR